MLSPRGSQITSKPDAGPDDSVLDDALELKWELDEASHHYYVSLSLMYYMGCVKITSLATLL